MLCEVKPPNLPLLFFLSFFLFEFSEGGGTAEGEREREGGGRRGGEMGRREVGGERRTSEVKADEQV